MPTLNVSPAAEKDIKEIWKYIADDSMSYADKLIETIRSKFSLLLDMPKIGRYREDAMGLRSFSAGNYIIFYDLLQDGIEIVRVLHGARDIPSLFE